MCYAIPGKVEKIEGKYALVDYFGEKKRAVNEFDNLNIGDYIYAQGGYVIKVIPPVEANSILSVWKETFFELQDADLKLSRLDLEGKNVDNKLLKILDRAAEGISLKYDELLYLLNLEEDDELNLLYKTANFLRQKHLSNSCCVHGIIEFSNYCKRSCHYCGISCDNKSVKRYRMSKDEILASAQIAIEKYGFQSLVLQSGEDPSYTIDDLCEIVSEIKKRFPALIFISFGETGIDGLKKLYDAGARGLLMRFETSDNSLYEKFHPGMDLSNRLSHLKEAYKMGYMIITGGLIGLPGQSNENILSDIMLAKELSTEMYTFGPFIPHPDTPLRKYPSPRSTDVLKALAVSRICDPENAKIVITTAFETIDKSARELGLMAGANSVMLNVTPDKYKCHYSIYPARAHEDESIERQIEETITILRNLGRAPTDISPRPVIPECLSRESIVVENN